MGKLFVCDTPSRLDTEPLILRLMLPRPPMKQRTIFLNLRTTLVFYRDVTSSTQVGHEVRVNVLIRGPPVQWALHHDLDGGIFLVFFDLVPFPPLIYFIIIYHPNDP